MGADEMKRLFAFSLVALTGLYTASTSNAQCKKNAHASGHPSTQTVHIEVHSPVATKWTSARHSVSLSPVEFNGTILDALVQSSNFSTLLTAAVAADLEDVVRDPHANLVIFAPTNDAFAKIPADQLGKLLQPEARDTLASVLQYHASSDPFSADRTWQPGESKSLNMISGGSVTVARVDGGFQVNDSMVVGQPIQTRNGLIYPISSVLMPGSEHSSHSTAMAEKVPTIVEIAAGNEQFSTLVAAVKAADLVDVLQGDGPFTVFAPTNEAFAALGQETIEKVLKPENKELLVAILKQHVVAGRQTASELVAAGSAESLTQPLSVGIREGRIAVGEASVLTNDIEASNGVIHVIDKVLLPK
jgi:transforming growth factor-beta-induced protein